MTCHKIGIASTNVLSGGWSKPSPTSLAAANKILGASSGNALSSTIKVVCLFLRYPSVQDEQSGYCLFIVD